MKILFLSQRERQLFQRRPITDTQIYCGNCSSYGKTVLTLDGKCATCGGRSYVLAAIAGPKIAATRHLERQIEREYELFRQEISSNETDASIY